MKGTEMDLQENMTVNEAAQYLRVTDQAIWNACKQGRISAYKLGRRWLISKKSLLALERRARKYNEAS
jgi:excisionase family DNA binding protein